MAFLNNQKVYPSAEAAEYEHFSYLLESYFHQDFDISGGTLEEVLTVYRLNETESERLQTVADVERFLQDYGQSDNGLSEALERIFRPEVIVEGWEGLTTRGWLEEVLRLLWAA